MILLLHFMRVHIELLGDLHHFLTRQIHHYWTIHFHHSLPDLTYVDAEAVVVVAAAAKQKIEA